jgi:hypothetical protein
MDSPQESVYNPWKTKVTNSNKFFGEWHTKFRCDILEEYYEGFQWKGKKDFQTVNYNPYTINLFYSTIKIKLASLLFQRPSYLVTPRPGNSNWDLDFAVRSAEIKQDTLNTIIQNPRVNFTQQLKLAALDSFFRFAILEVGYAADWRNPLKEEPLLSNHDEAIGDTPSEKIKVIEDNELPLNERFYFKRVNPKRFRTSVSDGSELSELDWCGYYDYYYTETLRHTKGIKFPKDYESQTLSLDYSGGVLSDPGTRANNPEFIRLLTTGKISKVWRIWDEIAHKQMLLLDGNFEEIWTEDFERLPFLDLRWDLRTEGWYPIPPAFQWISSQDEINEAREQTRSFRRRFTRKFQAVENTIDELEKEKFASGPDGVIITVKQADAITPIQNPEQGRTAEEALVIAKEDFNIISGTSAEARGQSADRETATAAKIIDARSQIRESAEQLDFSNFICDIGRETLAQAAEKLTDGLWVKYSTNPGEQVLTEVQVNQPYYKWIRAQDLADGYDCDVDIDVMNATPAAQDKAKQSYLTFLSICKNFPETTMSPAMIRENAYRCGYRNEKIIGQMQQVAIAALTAKAQQMNQGALPPGQGAQPNNNPQDQGAGGGFNVAKAQVAQQATPDDAQMDQQLNQQVQ